MVAIIRGLRDEDGKPGAWECQQARDKKRRCVLHFTPRALKRDCGIESVPVCS